MNHIDDVKLHKALKKLRRGDLFELLIRAIEQLPKTRFPKVFEGIIDLEKMTTTGNNSQNELLTEVRHFHKQSLSGQYYESFNVNSKNYMKQSFGTKEWIRECNRLFSRCISESKQSDEITIKALSMLFELLRDIDKGNDNVVFFADEAGSWQVGVDWDKVLPIWFYCLSKTTDATEFYKQTLSIIEDFVDYDRKKFLAIAYKKASMEQRKTLPLE